ncbi:MAG: toast rack family protein [Candidatus Acidiferrum sp.]
MSRDDRVRSSSVVFPLLLIGLGTLFLLRRWVPDFYPWPVLWKYWPLLLILVGAGMFWDRSQRRNDPQGAPSFPVGSTIGMVLFLLVLVFLLWHGHAYARHGWVTGNIGSGHHGHEAEVVDRKDAKAVRMFVHMPAGQLEIQGGAGRLMEAEFFQGAAWLAPSIDYSVEQGVGTLNINQDSASQMMGNSDNTWKLKVSDEVPLELKVDIGAGRSDLNLANVDLTRLEVNIGAGQVNVDLTGERGKDLQAEVHGGVGEAIVRLPKNVGVVATAHGGLGSIDVRGLKEESDGHYVNAAYGKAPSTIHLTVEGGIGHIKLEEE